MPYEPQLRISIETLPSRHIVVAGRVLLLVDDTLMPTLPRSAAIASAWMRGIDDTTSSTGKPSG